jgi:predicted NodU family carbamoyl transferase
MAKASEVGQFRAARLRRSCFDQAQSGSSKTIGAAKAVARFSYITNMGALEPCCGAPGAGALARDHSVSWFQGRMGFGPRAQSS